MHTLIIRATARAIHTLTRRTLRSCLLVTMEPRAAGSKRLRQILSTSPICSIWVVTISLRLLKITFQSFMRVVREARIWVGASLMLFRHHKTSKIHLEMMWSVECLRHQLVSKLHKVTVTTHAKPTYRPVLISGNQQTLTDMPITVAPLEIIWRRIRTPSNSLTFNLIRIWLEVPKVGLVEGHRPAMIWITMVLVSARNRCDSDRRWLDTLRVCQMPMVGHRTMLKTWQKIDEQYEPYQTLSSKNPTISYLIHLSLIIYEYLINRSSFSD